MPYIVDDDANKSVVAPAPAGAAAEQPEKYTVRYVKLLQQQGLTVDELKKKGFCADVLFKAGVATIEQLVAEDYTLKELKAAKFTAKQLKQAGEDDFDIMKAGFDRDQLASAGINISKVVEKVRPIARHNTVEFCKRLFSAWILQLAGVEAIDLLNAGFDKDALDAARITCKQLKVAGGNVKQLVAAGYEVSDLRIAGFTAKNVKRSRLFND